jgi:hypothetical protein
MMMVVVADDAGAGKTEDANNSIDTALVCLFVLAMPLHHGRGSGKKDRLKISESVSRPHRQNYLSSGTPMTYLRLPPAPKYFFMVLVARRIIFSILRKDSLALIADA